MADSLPLSPGPAFPHGGIAATATSTAVGGESRNSTALAPASPQLRHLAFVRITHWLVVLVFFALLVSGAEIVLSHPRFYWGETGNVNTEVLFKLPVPSSRALVPTGYGYVLPDQNGWSRSLHFQSAWLLVFVAVFYIAFGISTGHFRRHLLPALADLSPKALAKSVVEHLRFKRPSDDEFWSYNVLQRLTYLFVIFVVFPFLIWTGLAMSPAFTSAFPSSVTMLGGRQSARTLHFFLTIFLVLFLFVHIFMVVLAGFRARMRAMITGTGPHPKERA